MSLPSKKISAAFGAALLALPLAANVSTPAYAGDVHAVAFQQSNVPVKDIRSYGDQDQEFLYAAKGLASRNGIAVIVSGDHDSTFTMANTAANKAKGEGVPVRFLLRVASNADSVEVFADGQKHSTIKNPTPGDSQTILQDIRVGWKDAVSISRELRQQHDLRKTAGLTPEQ